MQTLTNTIQQEKSSDRLRKKLAYSLPPYLFLLPVMTVIIMFRYIPMAGIQIAFRDYLAVFGFFKSPWVGLKHFERFFDSPVFSRVLINTLKVNFFGLIFGFPWPVILALILNEEGNRKIRNICQTISYAPHFISVVVVVSMLFIFTSPSIGVINTVMEILGGNRINFMIEPGWFIPLYILSGIWQQIGWSAIIYMATLTGIDLALYEAAIIDGANRFQRIIYITIPHLVPIMVIQLILRSGHMLDVGFEKVFLMQTPLNQSASEVISTYVYRSGFLSGQFSYATAVGLFKSLISLALIMSVNRIARQFGETSLW